MSTVASKIKKNYLRRGHVEFVVVVTVGTIPRNCKLLLACRDHSIIVRVAVTNDLIIGPLVRLLVR